MAYRFSCGAPDCQFAVTANDAEEIVAIVRRHAREQHDRTVEEDRVRDRMEAV